MPNLVNFYPLSIPDVFSIRKISVYRIEGSILIVDNRETQKYIIHLFENFNNGVLMYGLNCGKTFDDIELPFFNGVVNSIEILYAQDEKNWDCGAITLLSKDGETLRIERNNDSFPEPVFEIR